MRAGLPLSYDLMVDGAQKPLADARYLLSPGDLCTVPQVPEIVAAGVGALKIEGTVQRRRLRGAHDARVSRGRGPGVGGETGRADSAAEAVQLEQVYSRGLGPWFASGTNHQTVVQGRAPRHRGVRMGRVVAVEFRSCCDRTGRCAMPSLR
jgi:putative protease